MVAWCDAVSDDCVCVCAVSDATDADVHDVGDVIVNQEVCVCVCVSSVSDATDVDEDQSRTYLSMFEDVILK